MIQSDLSGDRELARARTQMKSKKIDSYKQNLKLANIQRSILVGLLLGDGHLETQDKGKTYRLKVEHSKGQSDYTEWLYKHFEEWILAGIYEKDKYGKKYVGFASLSHGAFRFYGQQFYENKKKKIPSILEKLIDELSLAVWFMDDGSWKSSRHKTFIIHSLGFSKKDLGVAQKVLQKRFNIQATLHRQKGKYWRIYILSESADDFRKIIEPYTKLFPSMKSKMGNTNA